MVHANAIQDLMEPIVRKVIVLMLATEMVFAVSMDHVLVFLDSEEVIV